MKKISSLVLFFLLAVSAFCSDISIIDFSKIKNYKKYENELLSVKDNKMMFQSYYFEEHWPFQISKEDCGDSIEELYKLVCQNEEKKNVEYYLLKAVVSDYLYNFDRIQFTEVENNYLDLQKMKKHDYRCEWFLASFYSNSVKPEQAMELIKKVVATVPEKKINPSVYYDYGIIALAAFMPGTSKMAFDKYCELTGTSSSDIPFYKGFEENYLKDYDGSAININTIYSTEKINDKIGLYSRFTGSFLYLKDDWIIKSGGALETTGYFFIIQSENIESNDRDITYSIMPIICANSDVDSCFATAIYNKRKAENEVKEITLNTKIKNLKAYEFTNKDMYPEIGGAHGIMVTFTVDYSKDADANLDHVYTVPSNNNGTVNYYSFKEDYRRYEGPVTYTILLDSCGYIFEESKQGLIDFLNNSLFE